eukprot:292544-Pyramimonas_sp.AAC.1
MATHPRPTHPRLANYQTIQGIQSGMDKEIKLSWYHKTFSYTPLQDHAEAMTVDTLDKASRYALK